MAKRAVTVKWTASSSKLTVSGLRTRLFSQTPDQVRWKCTNCSMSIDYNYAEGTPFLDAYGNPITHFHVASGATTDSGPPTAALGQGESGHRYTMTVSVAGLPHSITVDPDVVVDDGPPRARSKKSAKKKSAKKKAARKSGSSKKSARKKK